MKLKLSSFVYNCPLCVNPSFSSDSDVDFKSHVDKTHPPFKVTINMGFNLYKFNSSVLGVQIRNLETHSEV